ncbi:MAG: cache domain-containing protein, partial [Roseburia sp.]|nr:cache domain-containing protein [Roseburia sp.]
FYDNYYNKLQEILKAYVNGFPSIDSIYLYSEYTNSILSATENTSLSNFKDTGWLGCLDTDTTDFQIYFRAKYDYYPYVLSIIKPLNVNGYKAAIVINVNLNNLSPLTELKQNSTQAIYLISDDSEILFRNHQRALAEPIALIPELSNFCPEESAYTALITDQNVTYAYTQLHSDLYPWSYVMVTQLYEYSSKLSSSRAIFTTMLISLFLP